MNSRIRGVLVVIPLLLVAWVPETVKAEQVGPTAEKAALSTLEQLNRYSAEVRNTTEQVTSVS